MSLSFAAASLWGPALCAAGAGSLLLAGLVHGILGHPTILRAPNPADRSTPTWSERISVHLIIYGAWGLGFGAVIWRGVPEGMIDVRFAFERQWPVWESAEWVYLSVYVVPVALPWLAPTRDALRRYAFNVIRLLLVSLPFFLLLPLGSPPRAFSPTSIAGAVLAWETGRPDFAAAALPSFHVFWGLLVAQWSRACGRGWAWIGWAWAIAITAACVANGAHALLDVTASWLLFFVLTAPGSPVARRFQVAEDRLFFNRTAPAPSNAPKPRPPSP